MTKSFIIYSYWIRITRTENYICRRPKILIQLPSENLNNIPCILKQVFEIRFKKKKHSSKTDQGNNLFVRNKLGYSPILNVYTCHIYQYIITSLDLHSFYSTLLIASDSFQRIRSSLPIKGTLKSHHI